MKTILLIGDSIRMGYAPLVKEQMQGEAEFWEPHENGGTSRNVLAHLDEWVISRPAEIVHLNCGLHDLARDVGSSGVRVEIEEYESNLREILLRIQSSGKTILWATITPVHQENHRAVKGMERWESDVEKYNALASRVAQELGVPINDLNGVIESAGKDRVLQGDGVHYGDEGNQLLARAVSEFMRRFL